MFYLLKLAIGVVFAFVSWYFFWANPFFVMVGWLLVDLVRWLVS